MDNGYTDGQTHQAADDNQLLDKLSGYGVIAGGSVTEGADPYHVEVESVNAYFDGDTQSPGSTTIDLQSYVDSFNPKKVLICVNESGSYEVREGEPEQAKPRGNIRFQTNRPAYPDLHDVTGVIPLAGVWLGSSAEDIVNGDIEDRRRSPDVTLRNVTVENLIARTGITDGADVDHEGELADSVDIRTDSEIEQTINDDGDHGATADHDYFTDVDARDAVEETTDAADLSGAVGSDGQHLVTDGTNPLWQDMPGPENNQSLDTGDDVTFNSVTQQDATVNNQITWPDGTVTTESPSASAGAVTVFPDLGDVSVGALTNRPSPDGSQGWYFTNDSNGIFYDTGTWSLIAENPGNIDPGDLPFDPAFKSDSVTVNAGNLLNNGGEVSIGNSITIDVDEAALVNALDDDYVADADLDGLAITHGGDSLDGTYTIPQGDAIELNNGWKLTDDGSGNIVLNKGSGDGYEVRAVKDANGNTALEIDGLQLATESFANSTFIKLSNEGNLEVANADNADEIGQNGPTQSRSSVQMNGESIFELPETQPEFDGQVLSRGAGDDRYVQSNRAGVGEVARRSMTHTPAYTLEPGEDKIIGRFSVPDSAGGHHLWAAGTNELSGRTSYPQFKVFNRQDGVEEQIFTTNSDRQTGNPIYSNFRNLIELRIHNSNDNTTIEATASYAITIE